MDVKKRIEKPFPAVFQYVPYLGNAITKPSVLLDMIAFPSKLVNVNIASSIVILPLN